MVFQFGDDLFHALFKLPAVRSTGYHRGHIKCHNPFAVQHTCFVTNDTQCQAFNDSGLTDTGFTNEDRVVLLASTQDLHHALYLHFTSHHRIQYALCGLFGQVTAVLIQSGRLRLLRLLLLCLVLGLPSFIAVLGFFLLRLYMRSLKGCVRLVIQIHQQLITDIPGVLQILGSRVQFLAHDSQQHMHRTHRVGVILTTYPFRNAQYPFGLSTPLHMLCNGSFTSYAVLQLELRLFRSELRPQQQVIRRTLEQPQGRQQQVFGFHRCTHQTLCFILRIDNNPVQILCYYHISLSTFNIQL